MPPRLPRGLQSSTPSVCKCNSHLMTNLGGGQTLLVGGSRIASPGSSCCLIFTAMMMRRRQLAGSSLMRLHNYGLLLLAALLSSAPCILSAGSSPLFSGISKPTFASSKEATGNNWRARPIPRGGGPPNDGPERVLIIDVDYCLYSERDVKASSPNALGIEEQIITRTHEFCKKH